MNKLESDLVNILVTGARTPGEPYASVSLRDHGKKSRISCLSYDSGMPLAFSLLHACTHTYID